MTPFEAKGWTKDMKFKVYPNRDRRLVHQEGTVVWLDEDDGTDCPVFTDGVYYHSYNFWELEPVPAVMAVNGQEGHVMVSPEPIKPVTKDTIFDIKLTGEELLYLAVSLGESNGPNLHANNLEDSVYAKVSRILKKVADPAVWVNENPNTIELTVKKVFPPQETPEQKQYKELLAQREALDAQLAQLSQKLNLKERIGGV